MKEQTTKFTKIKKYLNTNIEQYEFEKNFIQNRIDLYKAIINILDKRSVNKRIFISDYENLAKYSCPDYSTLFLFEDSVLKNLFADNFDDPLSNCPNITCGYCWKEYINKLIETVNDSDLVIKTVNFPKEDEDK